MESHAMEGAFISQLTSAAVVVYLLQFLKRTSWYPRFAAWLPMADAHVHRVVSVLGAFVSAVGVHIAFSGNAATGWQFAGTIPPLAVLAHACWDWAQQFALNQLTYDAVAQRAGGLKVGELVTLPQVAEHADAPLPPLASSTASQRGLAIVPVILIVAGLSAGVVWIAKHVHSSAPTPVAAVADVATKIEQSANVALHSADMATSTPNPLKPGTMLVTRAQLDQVALLVDKVGRGGQLLASALRDYSAVKAAGGDLTAQRANIQQIIADLTTALNSIGTVIPSGTVAAIDQAVNDIIGLIVQVKAGVL